jgi:hypothetical protein
MRTRKLATILAVGLTASIGSPAAAGPCAAALDALQPKIDALVDATAGKGKFGVESDAATMSRQPTPDSIAAAEAGLGEGRSAQEAIDAMGDARDADAAGDKAGCEKAIEQIRSVLRQ